ncbi:MAG: alpha-glucuronidase [Bacteroidaceae bacterium]|nr:alpha-glucuronidase [Bacteroidaceae bacterium]
MKHIFLALVTALTLSAQANNGSQLWFSGYRTAKPQAHVSCKLSTPTAQIAVGELTNYYRSDARVQLSLVKDKTLGTDGFRVTVAPSGEVTVQATTDRGLLYGAYELLRQQELSPDGPQAVTSVPAYKHRILNHWDNMDGSIERGYAGQSFFWGPATNPQRWQEYGRACASIGLNVAVINNVNASPRVLGTEALQRTRDIADALRPYGMRVALAINFSSPAALGGLPTSDPLDPAVQQWWKAKANEIYSLIPDFAGFLVKANSEGQPGPQDFGRTQADGANMLAAALRPHKGIVMWRSFIYAPNDPDRAKQAYNEFKPLDGQFADNVIIQVKNGPIDFQPHEPYTPLFGGMALTPVMAELQVAMEYLGQERWLTYLGPQWQTFLQQPLDNCAYNLQHPKTPRTTIADLTTHYRESAIAGVANTGANTDWCGSIFNQANWYAFGRLAWNPDTDPAEIAREWVALTVRPALTDEPDAALAEELCGNVQAMMMQSWQATVNTMMPLGLHHIFAGDHHYGPEPWYAPEGTRVDWTPPYYHKADLQGIGFDRTQATGTGATAQYPKPYADLVENSATCPEACLLFFHHVPWDYPMGNDMTLWENLCVRYGNGLQIIRNYQIDWQALAEYTDPEFHGLVMAKLRQQAHDARIWHDGCLLYFQSINHLPFPSFTEPMEYNLDELKQWTEDMRSTRH